MRKLALLAALALGSVAAPASAAIVSYGFQLTPTSVQVVDERDRFTAEFLYRSPSSGSFTFNTDTNQLLSFSVPLALFADVPGIFNNALQANQPCDLQCFIGAVNGGSYSFTDQTSVARLSLGAPLSVGINYDGPNGSGRPITVSGTLRVTGAIPEPATWGLMLLGFGAIGASMRRRGIQRLACVSA